MAAATQRVVGSVEEVPDGFIPIAPFGARQSGGRGTDRYEWLLDAYQKGKIDAFKVMRTVHDKTGPIFVKAEQADKLISEKESASDRERLFQSAAAAASAAAADSATDSAAVLARIDALADGLQSIARGIDRLCELSAARPDQWLTNG